MFIASISQRTGRPESSSAFPPGTAASTSKSTASQPSDQPFNEKGEAPMFSVIFEVNPRTTELNTYLDTAKMRRSELESVEGFVDNIRYKSLLREGWILSLSGWRDEKSLVRWRTRTKHHEAQQKGRDQILQDSHLRVGQITKDTEVPKGMEIKEQRLISPLLLGFVVLG